MISVEIVGDSDGPPRPGNAAPRRRVRFPLFQNRTRTRNRHRRRICQRAGKSLAQSRPDTFRAGELATPLAGNHRNRPRPVRTRNPPTAWNFFFFRDCETNCATQLRQSPRVLRFRGLRGCVKQLAGARRWSTRCEKMQEQIVEYLRGCLTAEPEQNECALVVE